MRLVLVFALSLIFSAGYAQEKEHKINWMSIEEAQEAMKKEPRKIMIDVYTQWCGPCKMLDKNTFSNNDLATYVNDNYYAVKFDAETPDDVVFKGQTFSNPDYVPNKPGRNGVNQFSRALQVSAYPTVVFLDENLNMLMPLRGYRTPQQMEVFLKVFASDEYKNFQTSAEWEKYQNEFTPVFQ